MAALLCLLVKLHFKNSVLTEVILARRSFYKWDSSGDVHVTGSNG
jgi:hypothetical protein